MEERIKETKFYPNCDMTIWLRSCEEEETKPVQGVIYKEIPLWLEGSLLRNGPGGLRVGDSEFQHLFDGLALLHRFHISNGSVTYQNRFLNSQTYKQNTAAQRIVFTEFGTSSVPDPCQNIFQRIASVFERLKNQTDNAMISIYPFGDEYFAMTDGPFVHRIDPNDLSTKERVNLSEKIGIISHTAHPHVTADKAVYNLGMILSKTGPQYCILEFSHRKDEGRSMFETARIVASVPSRWRFHPSYMHTFGMTENYFVIIEQPLSVSLSGIVLGAFANKPLSSAFRWFKNETTMFYAIERSSGKIYRRYKAKAFFYLHIINQYEEENHLILDVCTYKDPSMIDCMYIESLKNGQKNPNYANMFRGRPYRFVMPLRPPKNNSDNSKQIANSKSEAFVPETEIFIEPELLCDLGCETPRINYDNFLGKRYKYFYAISSDVDLDNPGTLIKVDVEAKTKKTWCENNVFPSEPIFVPKPNAEGEDDGIILSALIWGKELVNQVGLLILDAKTWEEIGRAVFKTRGPVPKCLHGWFIKEK